MRATHTIIIYSRYDFNTYALYLTVCETQYKNVMPPYIIFFIENIKKHKKRERETAPSHVYFENTK